MKILITGGAGFIGSNLISNLLASGEHEITCIDNFDRFYPEEIKRSNIHAFLTDPSFRLIEGDIRDAAVLGSVGEIDTIVHLAAKAGVRPSILRPAEYQSVNVDGTQHLLEFAKERRIRQFVFASSSSVYGVNPNVPWNEDEKLLPISPYASTKLSAEMIGHVYSHLYGIRFLALRFFTVYGPGQRPDLAIHKFFDHILNGQEIPIYGDGSTSRDYTYVGDVVDVIVAALTYDRSAFEIINIGNRQTVTLFELVTAIEDVCQKKAIKQYLPMQAGDVPQTFADIRKAKQLLGYNPSTSLKAGLEAFYNWYISIYARLGA
jgi:UDP-glucuronate 4-epimerase